MSSRAFIAACAVPLVAACGEPPPPRPSAVIEATPAALCERDDFATDIVLSARGSQSRLTLVPVAPDPDEPALQLTWSFSGADHLILLGDEHAEELTVLSSGLRPLHVQLQVENDVGGVAEALTTIAITLRDAEGQCPLSP